LNTAPWQGGVCGTLYEMIYNVATTGSGLGEVVRAWRLESLFTGVRSTLMSRNRAKFYFDGRWPGADLGKGHPCRRVAVFHKHGTVMPGANPYGNP
jgi:hypothetical protein